MKVAITTTTQTKHELQLSYAEVKAALIRAGHIPAGVEDAIISMRVPGGGDWSNTDLSLGFDGHYLNVTWETKEVKRG